MFPIIFLPTVQVRSWNIELPCCVGPELSKPWHSTFPYSIYTRSSHIWTISPGNRGNQPPPTVRKFTFCINNNTILKIDIYDNKTLGVLHVRDPDEISSSPMPPTNSSCFANHCPGLLLNVNFLVWNVSLSFRIISATLLDHSGAC